MVDEGEGTQGRTVLGAIVDMESPERRFRFWVWGSLAEARRSFVPNQYSEAIRTRQYNFQKSGC